MNNIYRKVHGLCHGSHLGIFRAWIVRLYSAFTAYRAEFLLNDKCIPRCHTERILFVSVQ